MHTQLLVAARRRGFTLIELLIVVGILTILATLSLTTVKGLLKDQKITQGAQLAKEYFETARLRALTSGRPVAVFMDRVSLVGDSTGAAIPANFISTRLSIGEVFPPYTGDVIGATGSMWDINFNIHGGGATEPRANDNFADQIRFPLTDVASGFGAGGFIAEGDTIEFEGYNGRFTIERIDRNIGNSQVAVTFFNPPELYNARRFNIPPTSWDPTFEATHARVPPQIPVSNSSILEIDGTPSTPSSLPAVGFRVYRRPTKSLVGSVALPRGICIDLAASGFGPYSSGAGDASSVFSATTLPLIADTPANQVKSGNYSRIGVLFSADGRLSGVVAENNIGGIRAYGGGEAAQVLHLLVGKAEQVALGNATMQRSLPSDRDQFQSNLLDPANVWISCNPFTGEILASPVAAVPDPILANQNITQVVSASRAFSIAGVRK
jgi:prepilin-type N-terminal cleavage/methylation domain-containing protein